MSHKESRCLDPNPSWVYESPDPSSIYCYSPGIAVLPGGRIVVTMDLGGPGVEGLTGPKTTCERPRQWQGKILTSDDGGATWTERHSFPFKWARPFLDGDRLYVLGADGDLCVIRSDDGGLSWSEPARLTSGEFWHQAPGNMIYANGNVYLVMEKRTRFAIEGWFVGELAPVLLRGRLGADLCDPASWTFSSELTYQDTVPVEQLDYFGIPFYPAGQMEVRDLAFGRHVAPLGWLESNVLQFTDPDHIWCDPTGHTFHIWMRAHTAAAGYAAIAKVVEREDGSMVTQLETVPSGRNIVYVPCPGGHLKFYILYDEVTRLFWLLSSQPTDSMRRPDRMPPDRYGLPMNERNRLQLQFSRNSVDWCLAGMVDIGETQKDSRHYASMAIDGDDLLVASRSGDWRAKSAHDGNLITFHRVRDFRRLVY